MEPKWQHKVSSVRTGAGVAQNKVVVYKASSSAQHHPAASCQSRGMVYVLLDLLTSGNRCCIDMKRMTSVHRPPQGASLDLHRFVAGRH